MDPSFVIFLAKEILVDFINMKWVQFQFFTKNLFEESTGHNYLLR